MSTEYEFLSLIIQLITLILLFITSVAGIKYLLSNWKINRLAKKFEKLVKKKISSESLQQEIQKMAMKSMHKKDAKQIIEGTDSTSELTSELVRAVESINYNLESLESTLRKFGNYKQP